MAGGAGAAAVVARVGRVQGEKRDGGGSAGRVEEEGCQCIVRAVEAAVMPGERNCSPSFL